MGINIYFHNPFKKNGYEPNNFEFELFKVAVSKRYGYFSLIICNLQIMVEFSK